MCGICGYFGNGGEDRSRTIAAMKRSLAHRGPDDGGTWLGARRPIALGHTRLSILDLSPEGHQPMRTADHRWHLVFNGEIYNHRSLRSELEARGCSFRGHSDTEVLLAAIGTWGIRATLPKLVGMFALAVWDEREGTLTLAVDRLGEKPLYFGWFGGVFGFASELKALRSHPAWVGEPDPGAVADFLRHGYIRAPGSIYRGISKLLPGHFLELALTEGGERELRPQPYWSARAMSRQREWDVATDAEVLDELERRLVAAVELQRVADVPLGAFLSGGIDSSLIVALLQSRAAKPIRTFAIGFEEADYDESPHARAVAAHLGTEHLEAVMTHRDVQAVVPRLAGIYDEPFGDPSAVPVCFLASFARRHVTVSLSGDAGDELFLGYTTYRHVETVWRTLSRAPLALRRGVAGACARVLPRGVPHSRLRHRIAQAHRLLPAASPQEIHRLLTSSEIEAYLSPALREMALSGQSSVPASDGGDWRHDLSLADVASYLPGDILVKVDRAAMATGLETRVPLLDHRVVEFALGLPTRFKIRDGRGKWALRHLLDRYVPRALVERPKMGFGAPVGAWLRGPLREWADELLRPESLARAGLLNAAAVQALWRHHLAGRTDRSPVLWNILMLQSWLQSVETTPR